MKHKNGIVISFIILILFGICLTYYLINKYQSTSSSSDNTTLLDTDVNTDDDDEKIDWSIYETTNYELTESIIITKAGVYNLTGTIDDGSITINTSGNVKLILDNVSITNSSGSAILVKNAEDVVIETTEDSINIMQDGSDYDDDIGVIFSHSDLTFEGSGLLKIISNNEDGIVSTDDLKFVSGKYNINSSDDAIRGKDSVYIVNGTFNINASGDGIKATNDSDTDKGFIKITGGLFNITSSLDAIQAETKLIIDNGTFTISTGTSSILTSSDSAWGTWSNTEDSDSAKGLKSGDTLIINNGTFTLDTSDDAIHSNDYVGIKNATINISSGDDGIHADESLIIDSGKIDISQSYEGLEAYKLTINNGDISIIASDDGINVAGGNDSSSQNGRAGQNPMNSTGSSVLTINGGSVTVNASGDGLDANGSIYINGGNVLVYGPTNDGNGSVDYDSVLEVTDGTLIAGGSSGMLQSCSTSSSIYSATIVFAANYGENDIISIVDNNNTEIASFTGKKDFNALVVASPSFAKGSSYKILINGEEYESFTISDMVTTVGNINTMGNMQGRR